MISLEYMMQTIERDDLPLKRIEIVGRNMWRVGLMMQAHAHRVEAEERAIAQRLTTSRCKSAKQKVKTNDNVRVKTIKSRARERRREAAAIQGTLSLEQINRTALPQ